MGPARDTGNSAEARDLPRRSPSTKADPIEGRIDRFLAPDRRSIIDSSYFYYHTLSDIIMLPCSSPTRLPDISQGQPT